MSQVIDIFGEKRHLGDFGARVWKLAAAVGALALIAAALIGLSAGDHGKAFYFSYLVNYAFFLSLALGALFFVVLQHLTKAGWSVVVRRVAEAIAGALPLLALAFLPLLGGLHELYHWTHADAVAADPLLAWKQPYLNVPFFLIRWLVYLVVWAGIARYFFSRSVSQDGSGDPALTVSMQRVAPVAMVLYALTVTFASFDLLMSLDPHWFSTIFGVYFFAGSVVGFFALLPLLAFLLQRRGFVRHAITIEHFHDLGKLLFAFVVFWAYIAFSQYMLYWYANIPEETAWYARRQVGGWGVVGLVLLFGHFLLPFLALLSRTPKRRRRVLAIAGGWMLLMHWVDLFWITRPQASPTFTIHVLDLLLFIGLGGLFLAAMAFGLRERSLIPERDPRLAESLTFENA